nr:hypothetical protein [uncultured Duganella sp.]
MSKTGLWLCAIYGLLIAVCVGLAFSAADAEGRFVFLQLPIALQSALASVLGLSALLSNIAWPAAYLIFAGPVFLLLYGAGFLYEFIRKS